MATSVHENGTAAKANSQRLQAGLETVFTANEAAQLTKGVVEERSENTKHRFGYGSQMLNDYMIPSWPTDLELICGRPQNFKTGYMQVRLHEAVQTIVKNQALNECVVLVTWEVSVEQAMAYWLAIDSGISATEMFKGNVSPKNQRLWQKLETSVMRVGSRPFYIIGHSIKRGQNGRRKRPNLTMQTVTNALDYISNDLQKEVKLVSMDYLQRIPLNKGQRDRNEHYLQCVDWAKDMAFMTASTVMLGTQARREVDDYSLAIPKLKDSQWSSNAEQSADKFISLHMPKQKHEIGDYIDIGKGRSVEVTNRLLLLAVAKQKYNDAGDVFPLYVEPERLKMGDMKA